MNPFLTAYPGRLQDWDHNLRQGSIDINPEIRQGKLMLLGAIGVPEGSAGAVSGFRLKLGVRA